jgi:Flp pilus assembly protein TadD
VLAGPLFSATRVDQGTARAAHGDLTGALASAREAAALDPQAPEPLRLEANVLTDLGRPRQADAAFAAAYARSTHDWSILADWAAALLRRGDRPAARVAIDRARRLNPREQRIAFLAEAAR